MLSCGLYHQGFEQFFQVQMAEKEGVMIIATGEQMLGYRPILLCRLQPVADDYVNIHSEPSTQEIYTDVVKHVLVLVRSGSCVYTSPVVYLRPTTPFKTFLAWI
jgi:hypothetical protein